MSGKFFFKSQNFSKLAKMTKNGFFQYLQFWYFKTTLTILLKLLKMVDNNERNLPWKFQVREKSGTYLTFFHRRPIQAKNGHRSKFFEIKRLCSKSLRMVQFAKKKWWTPKFGTFQGPLNFQWSPGFQTQLFSEDFWK